MFYGFEHTYGANMVDSDGDIIGAVYRFGAKAERDAWLRAGPDYMTAAGYREGLKAHHPAVRRAVASGRWQANRDRHTGDILPGEVAY